MGDSSSVYTVNKTDKRVWVTIYDLGKTRHLDYGWMEPQSWREWTSGNYFFGSFYYVRGEVKSDAQGSDPNIYDTTVQINPQFNLDFTVKEITIPLANGPFRIEVYYSSSVAAIQQGTDNYYWTIDGVDAAAISPPPRTQ